MFYELAYYYIIIFLKEFQCYGINKLYFILSISHWSLFMFNLRVYFIKSKGIPRNTTVTKERLNWFCTFPCFDLLKSLGTHSCTVLCENIAKNWTGRWAESCKEHNMCFANDGDLAACAQTCSDSGVETWRVWTTYTNQGFVIICFIILTIVCPSR